MKLKVEGFTVHGSRLGGVAWVIGLLELLS
jgi:hypothetical protein